MGVSGFIEWLCKISAFEILKYYINFKLFKKSFKICFNKIKSYFWKPYMNRFRVAVFDETTISLFSFESIGLSQKRCLYRKAWSWSRTFCVKFGLCARDGVKCTKHFTRSRKICFAIRCHFWNRKGKEKQNGFSLQYILTSIPCEKMNAKGKQNGLLSARKT